MIELPSGFVFKLVDALLEALYGLLETLDSALGSGFKSVAGKGISVRCEHLLTSVCNVGSISRLPARA